MIDDLKRLYRGVAVHANAADEHEAALSLLLLMMISDRKLRLDEQDEIEAFINDSEWESDTFDIGSRFGSAMARARTAVRSDAGIDALLGEVDGSIASRILRSELHAACKAVAEADHETAPEEASLLAKIEALFGHPGHAAVHDPETASDAGQGAGADADAGAPVAELMTSRPPEDVGASIAARRESKAGSVPAHFAHDAARSYVDGDRM